MSQSFRVTNGLVDLSRTLEFTFNGKKFQGHPGDTLASALLANGLTLVGRSFKYHRPRGILTSGSEEPNALVQLHKGAFTEPNTRATTTQLFDGLEATSQNHRGSLKYDIMAITDWLSPFLSAGFYYKTFMWPKAFWEKIYEPFIRASAGLGTLSKLADPDQYDKGYLHCDILIIGTGVSGLMAAAIAARSGAQVIVVDEDFLLGGRLNSETLEIDNKPGSQWAMEIVGQLSSMDNVRVMARTTLYGVYDHGTYGALQRVGDHKVSDPSKPRQILWRIYAKHSILAAGATERSIAFGNNDRPGIMHAGAVRAYVNRWGVAPGKRVAIFTNNDDGWRTAHDLFNNGVEITAIIDCREKTNMAAPAGVRVVENARVINTSGRHQINSLTLANGEKISTDCLAVSGGWNPNVHLTCHLGSRPVWHEDISAFVPGNNVPENMHVIGAANGSLSLQAAIREGAAVSGKVVNLLGLKTTRFKLPVTEDEAFDTAPFWHVREGNARAWLDYQNDVTVKDINQAWLEGFRSVEHLKRYTTLGMGTDQGKTANIAALAIMAELTGQSIPQTGTTTFRPPYTPVPIGAFAGRARGKEFRPTRLMPSHEWAARRGAVFVEAGQWKRPQWFPIDGEIHWRQSVDREVKQTRASVGICDVTTLGKIDIQGKDAAAFLNKLYINGFAKLAIGKTRYGLMLREDGMAMDDGTTARLGEFHYVMTTTTANAVSVFRHMEFCRQCLWPNMDVHLISATEQWAQFAVAGPKARLLLQKIVDAKYDISNDAFAFMACAEITVANGTPARLFRISFSGELAYEIAVPSRYGPALLEKLIQVGDEFDVVAYGTEALGVMRIEKGHAAGNELNGQTSARDLGMGRMVSKKKDCIGNTLSEREVLNQDDNMILVGFIPLDTTQMLSAGAHFVEIGQDANTQNDQGWMSSVAYSPTLGHSIGLGFIKRGDARKGEQVRAVNLAYDSDIKVQIVSPHFVDPEGERLRV